jgi:hypothetical protein
VAKLYVTTEVATSRFILFIYGLKDLEKARRAWV